MLSMDSAYSGSVGIGENTRFRWRDQTVPASPSGSHGSDHRLGWMPKSAQNCANLPDVTSRDFVERPALSPILATFNRLSLVASVNHSRSRGRKQFVNRPLDVRFDDDIFKFPKY
jgi:hypothetical protein